MNPIKTSDVSSFIKDMINITMVYEVDEEGYVIKKHSGERVILNEGGVQRPLLIYQEVVKDHVALIINPLAESLMQATMSNAWFFNTQRAALLGRVNTLFIQIMKTALDEKKTKKEKDTHTPMELLNIAAKIIDIVDDRCIEEFIFMTEDKETSEFLTIWYQKKQLRSVLRCGLFDDDSIPEIPTWKSKFPAPKTRKKIWPVLDTIMLSILNIKDKDDFSKFTKKADVISCAKFSSFLNVLFAVYQEINPLLDIINPDIAIDLSKFAFHLNKLDAYTDNAKFMIQLSRSAPVLQPTQSLVPGTISTVPTAMPSFPSMGGQFQPAVSLVPGPVYPDGRISAPIPVMPSGAYPPGFMQVAPAMGGGYSGPYMPPQQQPQYSPYQQQAPQYGGYQPNIPFDGPYVTQGNFGNINLLPPGAPPGFNPNYR